MNTAIKQSDKKFYIDELGSDECQCGRGKKRGQSFCLRCYRQLQRHMQQDLWQPIGRGYEEAYDIAVKYLNA